MPNLQSFLKSAVRSCGELDDVPAARADTRAGVSKLQSFISSSFLNTLQKIINMADREEPPRYILLLRQAKRLALGEHPLAKYVPPLLLLADALLTSLIISKVACRSLHLTLGGIKLI